MDSIKKIAFIGGTGKLAVPVVKLLSENGFKIRAIVRDLDKAKRLLPANVELVLGNLKDIKSIEEGLENVDAVYINLATETSRLDLPFYEEREGVETIVKAAKKNNLKHIFKIGAGGAYPKNVPNIKDNVTSNIIRLQGQKYIEESGINYTIFDPTMFMDNLPNQINKGKLQWIGNKPIKNWWISADDYSKQVLNAINNPKAQNKHYLIQGPELLTPQEVFKRFIKIYDPAIKVQSFPLWLLKAFGIFNAKMKFMVYMFTYFEKTEVETFNAADTWEELGKPTITIDKYAEQLKSKK